MTVNWQNLATAAACLLEYERLCDRRVFIDEASLVRAAAECPPKSLELGTNHVCPEWLLHQEQGRANVP